MTLSSPPSQLESLLLTALDQTADGIGILSPDDQVIYANKHFAALFCDQPDSLIGKTFNQKIIQTHRAPDGLNIETDNIDDWLAYANSKRRKQPFRSIEIDTKDGRWMLLSEQILDDGHMLVYFTDISHQKQDEKQLRQLTNRLQYQADTDELTGTNNRRNFLKQTQLQLEHNRRQQTPCALLLLDIDHFKQINDRYGHPGGDQVLIDMVTVFQQALRSYDILGRIGGEEFAVFVPEADARTALNIAERIRIAVNQWPFEYQQQDINITISIGLVSDDGSHDLQTLFKHADKALYQAKDNGRCYH
ncbi:MAG: diguanylate cyclase [Motiliproteus sp.]